MDKKAKDILFHTYWSSAGWKDDRHTEPEDFAYAKAKGLMFDPLTISHDDCVRKIAEITGTMTTEQVAKAFLSSLSAHRLDWRSGIASYDIGRQIPLHSYRPEVSGYSYDQDGEIAYRAYTCGICRDVKYGVRGREHYENEDLNVLNFERIKWGGVRHGDLLYTLFDLQQFAKEQIPEPKKADIELLKEILRAAESCERGAYPSVLREKLKDIPGFKSNKSERSVLLEILACIGVLEPGSYNRPTTGKNDWVYVEFWRGEDGCNAENVEKFFGKYLKGVQSC